MPLDTRGLILGPMRGPHTAGGQALEERGWSASPRSPDDPRYSRALPGYGGSA